MVSGAIARTAIGIGASALLFFAFKKKNKKRKGDYMYADVDIVEGGRLIETKKMHLTLVKEFSDGMIMYENEDGKAVVYSQKDKKYTLVSIDMA